MAFNVFVEARETVSVGGGVFLSDAAVEQPFSVVFEDDGETGYFYAHRWNTTLALWEIVDALHVYNVEDVADRQVPAEVKIGWSRDDAKAVLFINDQAQAAFDFPGKCGYCRSEFPAPARESGWRRPAWSDEVEGLFA